MCENSAIYAIPIILISAADLEQAELNYDKVKRELETTLSELQEM